MPSNTQLGVATLDQEPVERSAAIVTVLLGGCLFALDLLLPLGVAAGVPYVALALIGLYVRRPRYSLFLGILSTSLILLGYYFSPPLGIPWVVIANRSLAIGAVWATTLVCIWRNQIHVRLTLTALELKEVAQNLREANVDLAHRNRELDEFSYIASHDLQEPLRKLISFSQLLEEDAGDELSEDAKQDIEHIVSGAERMQRLVRDLLEFSRVGKGAVKYERVSLNACVDEALDNLAIPIREKHAEIVRENLPDVMGDRTLLTQLYQNLISNALKFSGEEAPSVRLTAETGNAPFILGVSDNGIGIDQKYAQQIFSPFQRLHGRDEYEGTGVGLAICRKAVEVHEGRIWVESSDTGAHFKFTLKRLEAAQGDEPTDISQGQAQSA